MTEQTIWAIVTVVGQPVVIGALIALQGAWRRHSCRSAPKNSDPTPT